MLTKIEKALDELDEGHWAQAHNICQEREGEFWADWVHAHLHKEEGDRSNAAYWYRRCGEDHLSLSCADERQLIRQRLREADQ